MLRAIPQYRRPFFDLLRPRLADSGIDLKLIYGQGGPERALRMDLVDIPWGTRIRNVVLRVGSRELYWQPCLRELRDCDLVVVIQEAKLLVNYVILLQRLLGRRRVAFWGHGRNSQEDRANAVVESAKRWMARQVDWWFAYTDETLAVLRSYGFPEDRISVVHNAIDTKRLQTIRAAVSPEMLSEARTRLRISSANVCIYSGSMYREKRLSFLLEACVRVRELIPDFEIILLGAGADAEVARAMARNHHWIHFVGPMFDAKKVPYFMISKLLLIPSAVGLAILDAFALEVPLVTTSHPSHGPEIAYLLPGENGVMVEEYENPSAYAEKVIELLRSPDQIERLKLGCRESAKTYTVETMVDNFAEGIRQCLRSPGATW